MPSLSPKAFLEACLRAANNKPAPVAPTRRTPRLYAVQATIEVGQAGWVRARQVPTFYLDPNVQGIRDERHAHQIAAEIIGAKIAHIHVEPIY